jgi:hypothetical protein
MNQRSTDPCGTQRNPSWYRQEADRLRQRATAITADDQLRDSYLSLAREYERLAEVLEGGSSSDRNTGRSR